MKPSGVSETRTDQIGAAAAESVPASQSKWQLVWRKFRRHRLAVWAGLVVIALYVVALFCQPLSPYGLDQRQRDYIYAPPQPVHVLSEQWLPTWPYVYGLEGQRDPRTLERVYTVDRSERYPLRFGVRGASYKLLGLIETDWHLAGVTDGGTLFLLGTDSLGRDLLTRILYGARISLSIGLVGVCLSVVIGVLLGGLSGYLGGLMDQAIQRLIELIRSFPSIPLWMALAAALPATWSPLQVYFGITVVLSLIGWTGLARQVRGKVLALREEDYVTAARLMGVSRVRVLTRHLLPGVTSHLIVTISLAVPQMILGETALSFLGLGLQPPATSWGVLLQEAQNVQAVAMRPWLLVPVVFVIVTVLAFNFLGDGFRDAADPYAR